MNRSLPLIKKINSDFKAKFGRSYGNGLLELYRMNDAKYAVICMGTICGTARVAVDALRAKGKKVGLIKLKSLRPFPEKDLQNAMKGLKGLGVLDRHISLGFTGPLYSDVKTVADAKTNVLGYIAGLGGRDVTTKHFEKVFSELAKGKGGGWLL
ncbi:MAG: pyruvate ferredoxin oxidoreductase, partial [Candidatus Diapherotrites archaeon]|nr:pyruvate ferredoxin oxidoreductase [Candidatus Diapherotrites archaeon]